MSKIEKFPLIMAKDLNRKVPVLVILRKYHSHGCKASRKWLAGTIILEAGLLEFYLKPVL